MLLRELELTNTKDGRADFRLLYESFRSRDPQKCVGDERTHLAAMQRQLEAVSDPVGELPAEAEEALDARMRKLKPEGGTIKLPAKVYEKLEKFVDETPFQAGVSLAVEGLKDRMAVAPKVEADT